MRILAGVLSITVGLIFAADQKPTEFSGIWKMDLARSESAHQGIPIGPMTLVIKQTPTQVSIETKTGAAGNTAASTETLTYKLDGTEETTSSGPGAPIKTKARWDGPKLIIETLRTVNGTPVTIRHALATRAGGKELTVEKTLMVQHGYQSPSGNNVGTGTDVFVRTTGPR